MSRWLLVDIDALLDTRLGVVSMLNKEAAEYMLAGDAYLDRIHDDWYKLSGGRITNEEFKAAYALRGGENTPKTFAASFETGMYPFIMTLLSDDDANVSASVVKETMGITFNLWPYEFDFNAKQSFKAMMHAKFGSEMNIRLVSYAPEDLSVEMIASEYGGMIINNFHDWIKIHYEEIARTMRSDINIIYPKICETDPSQLSMEQLQHEFTRFRTEHLLNLDMDCIDAKYFSIIDLRKKKDNRPRWLDEDVDFPLIPDRA